MLNDDTEHKKDGDKIDLEYSECEPINKTKENVERIEWEKIIKNDAAKDTCKGYEESNNEFLDKVDSKKVIKSHRKKKIETNKEESENKILNETIRDNIDNVREYENLSVIAQLNNKVDIVEKN